MRTGRASLKQVMRNLTPTRTDLSWFASVGFLGVVVSQTCYFYALSKTSLAIAVTLNYTAPLFAILVSRFLYSEAIGKWKMIALVGALMGVGLVSGLFGETSGAAAWSGPGLIAGLVSGLTYGCQTVAYRRLSPRYTSIRIVFWTTTIGAVMLFGFIVLFSGELPGLLPKMAIASSQTWLRLALLGLGSGAMGFMLYAKGLSRIGSTRGSILAMSEPAASCLLGYFMYGELLTAPQTMGLFIVLVCVWVVSSETTAGDLHSLREHMRRSMDCRR